MTLTVTVEELKLVVCAVVALFSRLFLVKMDRRHAVRKTEQDDVTDGHFTYSMCTRIGSGFYFFVLQFNICSTFIVVFISLCFFCFYSFSST